jgi:hypothetical protein
VVVMRLRQPLDDVCSCLSTCGDRLKADLRALSQNKRVSFIVRCLDVPDQRSGDGGQVSEEAASRQSSLRVGDCVKSTHTVAEKTVDPRWASETRGDRWSSTRNGPASNPCYCESSITHSSSPLPPSPSLSLSFSDLSPTLLSTCHGVPVFSHLRRCLAELGHTR